MTAVRALKDYSPEELRSHFEASGLEGYRADQVLGWVYRRGVEDFEGMTDLSQESRRELLDRWTLRVLEIDRVDRSTDGTRKFALRCADGAIVEAVIIPEERRNTLCVSTQVGCPLECSFCATGAMGFARNLGVAEIVDQLCHARATLDSEESITNLVFMGMGEPLLNLSNVLKAIEIFVHPRAFAMAPRRITVSTVGIAGKIGPLLEAAPVNLAVSLHAASNDVRDRLVPLNRRIPLESLLDVLRKEPRITPRRPVFFEYTLIAGVNDSVEDARKIPPMLEGIPCRFNVIPMNPHADSAHRPPAPEVVDRFTAELHRAGLRVTLRKSRGSDIAAACGQLTRRKGSTAASGG